MMEAFFSYRLQMTWKSQGSSGGIQAEVADFVALC